MISRFSQTRTVLAGLAAVVLVLTGCTADQPTPLPPPNRILQSVAAQMSPDGTITAVNGTSVSVRDNAADATTETTTYSPHEVADDLPVRVRTSYRTADKTGTNLDELAGYTGRVEIEVTVQNLTVRPQELTYDVAGTSRTQPALVGSPLTVVGSVALQETTPTDIVTASAAGETDVTNGVLSHSDQGGSVVQWAALLASPQTGSTATLRLVTDAKDFQVPTFDISVQPGIVTDPSVGGVLDSAFNSTPTSQLALEQRTIKLITEVNEVLTRASGNISDVRKNLESTSETLGTRTVQDLQTTTKGVADSMKGLDQSLTSLNSDIASTLDTTGSSVLRDLSQTVSTMDQLLGDTSAGPPSPVVDGSGCQTVVKGPDDGGSVYANLMQVTAQLNGYATATKECKKNAQAALVRSVGPEKPNAEICEDKPSTTCSLYATEQTFSAIMADLVADGQELIDSLQPEVVADAGDQFENVSNDIAAVQAATKELSDFDPHADLETRLIKVTEALDGIDARLDELSAQLVLIRNDALAAREEITGGPDDEEDDETGYPEGSMLAQNLELADELCDLERGGLLGNGISDRTIDKLRAYLVSQSCPDDEGVTDDLRPPRGYDEPMDQRLLSQAAAWTKVITLTDVDDEEQGVGKELAEVRAQIEVTRSQVTSVEAAVTAGQEGLAKLMPKLVKSVDGLDKNRDTLGKDLEALKKQQQELAPAIRTAFDKAADKANDQVSDAIQPQIRRVTAQAAVDSEAVGEMFDASAAGLSNAAGQISSNGTRTINAQKRQLAASEKRTSATAAKHIDQSLKQMARGVSASTRDMNSASALLTANLKKVLLDLGTRKVNGSGLLGSMTTSAAKVGTADYQLALASETTTSYANVRGEDVNGILLRQAQLQAALQAGAELPAFHLKVPAGAESQTVYTFRIGDGR